MIIVAAAVVVVGTATAAAAAASSAAAAASFFASLCGSFEELVGVSSCRRVVAGGGVDLFGGVGCLPSEAVVFVVGTAATSSAAAAASFFASLCGGFEELVGVFSCRRVVAGGGVDLFGGVGSLPREAVVFAALQFFLE